MPIPFRQAGGPVNVYAIDEAGGGFALFDAGLGSAEAEAALEGGLRAAGRRFSEMTRVIVSHGHVDHYGGARTALEKAGRPVPVFAHSADIPKVSEAGPRWKDLAPVYGAFFLRHGVPLEALAVLASESAGGFHLARRLAEVHPVAEGEVLSFRHFRAELLHMPGHTPGLLCLWDQEHRIFFSDERCARYESPSTLMPAESRGMTMVCGL